VNRNDRLDRPVHASFRIGEVDIRTGILDIAHDGRRADIEHRPSGGDEGVGWDQYLVARTNAGCDQRQMQSRRS
jgi:hypothetical protein